MREEEKSGQCDRQDAREEEWQEGRKKPDNSDILANEVHVRKDRERRREG